MIDGGTARLRYLGPRDCLMGCDGKEWLRILDSRDVNKWVQMKVLMVSECQRYKKEIVSCYFA